MKGFRNKDVAFFENINVSRTKKCPTSILILELVSSNC